MQDTPYVFPGSFADGGSLLHGPLGHSISSAARQSSFTTYLSLLVNLATWLIVADIPAEHVAS